jgi:hypothetical protein
MLVKSTLAVSLLVPLAMLGLAPSDTGEVRHEAAGPNLQIVEEPAPDDPDACRFAILAKNNTSLSIWVDLYYSTVNVDGGFGLWSGAKELKIQNHRLTSGQTMNRRYEASGSCSRSRSWRFHVRIDRPSGKKIYKYLSRSTRGDGPAGQTIDLGNTSTWGL